MSRGPSGELLLVVLRLLEQGAMDSRELLSELDGLFPWRHRPTTGDILLALSSLEAERLVEVATLGSTNSYRNTSAGSAAVAQREEVIVADRPPTRARFVPRRASSPQLQQVTVLFTDIVRSTEMLDLLGDEAAHGVRRRHFELLRRAIDERGGREVKSLGDGLMVVFENPRAAASCALEMQSVVAGCEDELQLRIGIATGETVCEDDDYFGRAVVIARRLCDEAGGGETLAAGAGPDLLATGGVQSERCGPTILKGLSEPVNPVSLRAPALATAG